MKVTEDDRIQQRSRITTELIAESLQNRKKCKKVKRHVFVSKFIYMANHKYTLHIRRKGVNIFKSGFKELKDAEAFRDALKIN